MKRKFDSHVRANAGLEIMRRRARAGDTKSFVFYTMPNYILNWHHEVIIKKLQDFLEKKIMRLIITMPPRMGKTELISRFSAQSMGLNPNKKIISLSYGDAISRKLNRQVQKIIDSTNFYDIFPEVRLGKSTLSQLKRSPDSIFTTRKSDEFEIVGHEGRFVSSGRGGTITGEGADLLIVDDLFKGLEEANSDALRKKVWDWWGVVASSRLEKDAQALLVNTRWHEEDLIGRLLDEQKKNPPPDHLRWHQINFPAILEQNMVKEPYEIREFGEALWPDKKPIDELKEIERIAGRRNFQCVYQQSPKSVDGEMVKREYLKTYYEIPKRISRYIISCDLTFDDTEKSANTCISVYGKEGEFIYLLDQECAQMDIFAQMKAITRLKAKYPKCFKVVIEKKANGAAVIKMLEGKINGITPVTPVKSKVDRLNAVLPFYEGGGLLYPSEALCPWIADHIKEVLAFPSGALNDRVDAETMALDQLGVSISSRLEMLSKFY